MPVAFAMAVALFLLLGLVGGAASLFDVSAIRAAAPWRDAHPHATSAVILFTKLGYAPPLLTMAALGAGWLAWRREWVRLVAMGAAVVGGRIGIELIKLIADRPRPGFEAHPVDVHSQSFPSGHAGNSMLTFLSLALFVAPERWQRPAVAVAVIASLAMGATRPLLGVHWPTDVLAGWLYGAALVMLAWWWVRRRDARSAA
ncbi:hypothetical protein GCM10022211_13180 [Sphingomonas humi]|uniref:Phosphatidic acid phosphatase type 2/haloperoxidase domain-containing protein n=1 Tax=Sphingomonas humi TaxID=335630 RepID=A0ABP7RW65_9SPHN